MVFSLSPLAFIEGIGGPEMGLILIIVLVLFGGKKLPEFARGLGKSMREFKKAASGVEMEFKRALEEDEQKKYVPPVALPSSAEPPNHNSTPDYHDDPYHSDPHYGHEAGPSASPVAEAPTATPAAETPLASTDTPAAAPAATPEIVTAAPANPEPPKADALNPEAPKPPTPPAPPPTDAKP